MFNMRQQNNEEDTFKQKGLEVLNKIVEQQSKMQEQINNVISQNSQRNELFMKQQQYSEQQAHKQSMESQPQIKKLSEFTDEEYEQLTPQQIHRISEINNEKMFSEMINSKLSPIIENFNDLQKNYSGDKVNSFLEKAKNEKDSDGNLLRPDFDEWYSEMSLLHKENPSLSIERLYSLAKLENKEKDESLSSKFNKKNYEPDHTSFGGFMPNLMSGNQQGTLSVSDAAKEAYTEHVNKYGDELLRN